MNCEKITYYIEKGFLTKLNISERLQIRIHSMICECCKNYAPDSEMINKIMTLLGEENDVQSLSDGDKQKIKEVLQGLKNDSN